MTVTITPSTNGRVISVEGTMAEVLNNLDEQHVSTSQMMGFGYSGITNKIFFAIYKRK